jgi:uncharacterized protein
MKNNKFTPLHITEIKPGGWLKKQLEIQLKGLSGNLDKFYPQIKESSWFGGNEEGWERAPYWLDGVIPLAWLLDDKDSKCRIKKYVDYIIDNQHEDGWLGPKDMNSEIYGFCNTGYDIWGQILATKVLTQYYEITDETIVISAVEKALKCIDLHIDRNPLYNWGQARWFEAFIAICKVYELKKEHWLIDLAVKLRAQGFDWMSFYEKWPFEKPTEKKRWNYMSHVVNNAMAIKCGALCWKLFGKEEDKQFVYDMIRKLEKYHGTVVGCTTGDECLAGKSPVQGTELCSVVEYMYSLETLISILGDSEFSDRLEKITYNALPAALTEDMWAHQYDQQVNQIECSVKENRTWTDNRPDANIFGLQPDTACCTANFNQGWPKFAASLWMKTNDEGLACTAIAPCIVATNIKGVKVQIEVKTDYPFKHKVSYTVKTERKVKFPLYIRIPAWVEKTYVKAVSFEDLIDKHGYIDINVEWDKEMKFDIEFISKPKLLKHYKNLHFIQYGSLIFSHRIYGEWKQINSDDPLKAPPHGDWELYPASKWNYGLTRYNEFNIELSEISEIPFSEDNPPLRIYAYAKEIEWKNVNGSAEDITTGDNINILSGSKEKIKLIPYGCTKLRITEFPIVE